MRFMNFNKIEHIRLRVLLFILFFIISIVATLAGTLTPIDHTSAETIVQEVPIPSEITPLYILQNNLSIALVGFIPIIGILWMVFVLYSTGVVLSAFSVVYDVSPILFILVLIANPIFWIEYTAYTLVMVEGTMLVYSAFKKEFLKELKIALLILIAVVLLLTIGAFIEVQMLI
ncbi:MAG: stage II sporulation protein M [Candidatus Methylarchaceae archaeon HK01B]|nr:stage II sporulation protein M [Candidatus Methylarchaceae archaeon HK01B]